MELLYPKEHLSCFNYEKGSRPLYEKSIVPKGEKWNIHSIDNLIIFSLEGCLHFSFNEYSDRKFTKGKMMILPADCNLSGYAEEDSTIVTMRLFEIKQLCDCFSLDMFLLEKDDDTKPDLHYLDINERLGNYLVFLDACVREGLKCTFFLNIKVKELFFLLRAYYPKQDLKRFFYLLLSMDISFSDLVLKNHRKAKTVQELAKLLHYSLSGFQKRFKRAFGVSAYQWMKDERSKAIFHEINSTEKSFKEISDDYGFSSPSHFNDFCKTSFGATPGKIRQKKILINEEKEKKA